MKTFEEFKNDIKNGELKDKLAEFVGKNNPKTVEERTELLVKFASENGYEASAEDFALEAADKQVLDEAELVKIGGGFSENRIGGREGCVADYVCKEVWNLCVVSNECDGGSACSGNISCRKNDGCTHGFNND